MQAQQLLQILSSLGRGDRCLIFCEMKRDSTARDRCAYDTFEERLYFPGALVVGRLVECPKPRRDFLVLTGHVLARLFQLL